MTPARSKLTGSFCFVVFNLLASHSLATEYHFGVNAEVSYKESASEVEHRYTAFLSELSKVTGDKYTFSPVYSDRVSQAVTSKKYDFLLIHTHLALRAENSDKYKVVGFTEDRKNDAVFFFVRPDSPMKELADVPGHTIGVPGAYSWATATALSAIKGVAPASESNLISTRYQEAVPWMVELKTVDVGISRSKKMVDDYLQQKKLRVIHVTKPLPLNALIASPGIPATQVTEMRNAITSIAQSKSFDLLAFKGLRYSEDEYRHLHAVYK